MNEESNSPKQQVTIDKPEKDPRRIEAGKRLVAFNKMARKKKESGEVTEPKEPSHSEDRESNNEEMSGTTKILLLAGAAGLGY